jgi:hypothetical protein
VKQRTAENERVAACRNRTEERAWEVEAGVEKGRVTSRDSEQEQQDYWRESMQSNGTKEEPAMLPECSVLADVSDLRNMSDRHAQMLDWKVSCLALRSSRDVSVSRRIGTRMERWAKES